MKLNFYFLDLFSSFYYLVVCQADVSRVNKSCFIIANTHIVSISCKIVFFRDD